MLMIWTVLSGLLGMVARWATWRASAIEKRYVRTAADAEKLVQELALRGGNRTQPDACSHAKKQCELGRIVALRDTLETKYTRWQHRADSLNHKRRRLLEAKGRVAPYLMGVVDAAAIVAALLAIRVINDARTAQWVTMIQNSLK